MKNHNTEESNTYNSVGGYYDPSGTNNIKFVRDPDKLLAQYSNLIKATAKKYNKYWASNADKKELYSYIIDTFISLVYEYDINSKVDFQGYIKHMLDIRVAKSYSIPEKEKRDHISTLRSTKTTVENLVDSMQLKGDITSSTWFNSKKSLHSIVDDQGNKIGIDSKLTSRITNYELDISLQELLDELEHDDRINYIQLQIVYLLASSSHTPQTVLDFVAHKYKLSQPRIQEEYQKLKQILIDIKN